MFPLIQASWGSGDFLGLHVITAVLWRALATRLWREAACLANCYFFHSCWEWTPAMGAVLSQEPNGKDGKVLVLLQLLVSYPHFQQHLTSTSSQGFILSQEHIHTGNFFCTSSHTALSTAREWWTSHSTEGHEEHHCNVIFAHYQHNKSGIWHLLSASGNAQNTTPHQSTRKCQFFLLFGCEARFSVYLLVRMSAGPCLW